MNKNRNRNNMKLFPGKYNQNGDPIKKKKKIVIISTIILVVFQKQT